jgi:hypothetical protein
MTKSIKKMRGVRKGIKSKNPAAKPAIALKITDVLRIFPIKNISAFKF